MVDKKELAKIKEELLKQKIVHKTYQEGATSWVIDLLVEHDGYLPNVAKKIGVAPSSVIRYLKNNNLLGYLDSVRDCHNEILCDAAVKVLEVAMLDAKNTREAVRAAMFILEYLGKRRGFSKTVTIDDGSAKKIDEIDTNIRIAHKELIVDADCDVTDADQSV